MTRFKKMFWPLAAFSLIVTMIPGMAAAQKRDTRAVRDAIRNLRAQVDDFQMLLDNELTNNSSGLDRSNVNSALRGLQDNIDALDDNFTQKRENQDDVADVVNAAKNVDAILRSTTVNRRLESDWGEVKNAIESLASNYGVTAQWNGRTSTAAPTRTAPTIPVSTRRGASYDASPLTGTYKIDTARSENISDILTGSGASGSDQQDLRSKLEAPDEIALDISGSQVTLATSNADPVTISADGREKVEQANGRTIRLKATLRGNELQVSSLGGESDYTIIFASVENGRTLKVTRRITTKYLTETVFAESVYSKTDEVAGLGIVPSRQASGGYSTNDPGDTSAANTPNSPSPNLGPARTGEFIVPNGEVLTASLDNLIDTNVSQNNDRFKMTVQSPDEFRGAVIEGYLSGVGRSGQVSGRSNLTFNFDSITLRNGRRYDFAGSLQGIKDQNGKVVKVDTEGTAKGDSQTKETAKRGGIGAGLGALIGAIAGGGKGAVLGAIIGGGAGAGSVIATGRDDVKLGQGSTLTIQSSSPVRPGDQPVSEN